MSTTTTADPYKTTFHRDGTVTFWNVYEQQWNRRQQPKRVSDENLASMSPTDRTRVLRMVTDGYLEAFQP